MGNTEANFPKTLAYLQAVEEPLPDASREIKLAPKAKNTRTGKWQTWLFTDDGGFAR